MLQRKQPVRTNGTNRAVLLAAAAASVIGLSHSAHGANATWSAAPAGSNWNAANWVGGSGASGAAAPGDVLVFGSSTVTGLNNDFTAGTSFGGITFNATASPFTLNGNDIALGGPIIVNSGGNIAETIGLNIAGSATSGISMSSSTSTTGNNLTLNGNVAVGTLAATGLNTTATPANTLTIGSGKTLTVNGGITVGSTTVTDAARAQLVIAGGSVIAGASGANLTVSVQGNASSTNINAILDLSALSNFSFNGGATGNVTVGTGNRGFGSLALSNTGNLITANAFSFGGNGTSNGGNGTISLGAGTNVINTNTINIGVVKGAGGIQFANATNGTLKLRGFNGTDADRANVIIGSHTTQGTPTAGSGLLLGTHTVDMKVNNLTVMSISINGTTAGSLNTSSASLTFGGGTFDVNNIAMAFKDSGNGTLNGATSGSISMSGGNLVVNTSFSMMNAANQNTNLFSGFNLTGGSATINCDITQTGGLASNNVVTLNGGTLDMTGHNIGPTGSITLSANSGTLMNVAQINGGANGLTKATSGTLFLAGSNGYTGDTVINGGALVVNGSTPSTGNVAINGNAILSGSGNGTTTGVTGLVTMQPGGQIRPGPAATDGSVGTLTMNSLTVNGGDFRFDLTSPATTSDQIHVLGTANFTAGSTISPIFPGAAQSGDYTLLTANSLTGTAPVPNVPSSNTRTVYTVHFGDAVANALTLHVDGQAANLTWVGNVAAAGATIWDVKSTPNWTSNATTGNPNQFYDLDTVLFDDSAFGNGTFTGTVTLNTVASPTAVNVNNSAGHDYTLAGTGAIAALSTFTKSGNGSVTLTNPNTYAGTTTINSGTLILGGDQFTTGATIVNGGTLVVGTGTAGSPGSGSITVNSGGTLVFSRTDGAVVGNLIAGSGSVIKNGSGSLTLTATSTFTGAVNINSGTVIAVGSAVTTGVPNATGSALGAPGVGSVNIPVGSTLELGNVNLGTNTFGVGFKQVNVAGNGGGSGAIVNNGTTQFNAFRVINLTGDATFGGSQRFDMRANPTTALGGTLTFAGHTLHVGNGLTFGLVGIALDNGTIEVDGGTLSLETATQTLADPNSAIVLTSGSHLQFFQNTGTFSQTRQVIVKDGADIGQIAPSSFSFTGLQFALQTDLNIHSYGNGTTGTLTLLGNITEDTTPRKVIKADANQLVLAGSNTFTGGLDVQGGLVQLGNAAALNASGVNNVNIGGGDTLSLNGNSVTIAGLSGNGILENNNAAPAILTVNNANDTSFDGTMQNGAAAGSLSLIKSGAGRLTLNGSGTFTGSVTINNGTLQLSGGGNSGTLSASAAISGTGGTLSLNRNDDITFSNSMTGAINLSKENGNTVTMPGTYGYTGTTAIQSGTLLVTGVLPSNGTVNLNNDATLAGTGDGINGGVVGRVNMTGSSHVRPGASAADGSVGTLTMGSLSVSSGELRFDLGTTSDRITVTGAAVFNGGSISIAGIPTPGTYTILTAGALTLNTPPQVISPTDSTVRSATYKLNTTTANTLKIDIVGGPANLTWVGNLNTQSWDINTTKNWLNGSSDFFFNQDNVNFTDTGNHTVNISNGDVSPGSVVFAHSTGTYTLNGPSGITGGASVAITNGGTVVMNENNSYTGSTAVQNGTLVVGNANALSSNSAVILGNLATSGAVDLGGQNVTVAALSTSGTGAANVIGNSSTSNSVTLTINNGTGNFAGIIRDSINGGTQPVSVQLNNGTTTFSGNNTYTGSTQVGGGAALQIGAAGNTGSFGAGNLNVDGTLIFNRSNTLILSQDINGGGRVVINSGTVQVGAGGAVGRLPTGAITNNASLVYNRNDDFNIDAQISGTGTLYQAGTGTITITASNSFTGGINVSSGSVRIAAANAQGSGTVTLNGGTFVATATLGASPIVFGGGTFGIANSPAVLTSGDLYVLANKTTNLLAGESQFSTTSNGTFTGSVHGSGTLLTSVVGTPTTVDAGPGIRFSGTSSDFSGALVVGPSVKGEVASAVAGPSSPLGTGSIIMVGGTVTGGLNGTYSELNLRNNGSTDTVFGNNLSISGAGIVVINPINTTNPLTSTLGIVTVGTGQTLAVDKNTASGGPNTLDVAGFQGAILAGSATFQPVSPNGGWTGTASLIVGPISESVTGSSLTMNGLGLFTMTGSNSYTGGTNVQSGTLVTNTNFSNGPLNISGGVARVAAKANSADPSGVTIVPSVTITGGALDLTNNAMVVDYAPGNTPFSTIRGQIIAGFASGAWNGPGINSTSAAGAFSTAHPTALGYAEASTLGISSFAGQTVDNSSVLVRYTLAGDANLDGKVNVLDFNALASNFGLNSNGNWSQGDFTYDGKVTTSDFTALAQNFNAPLAAPALSAPLGALVPEPTVLGAVAMIGVTVRRRRRAS